MLVLTRKEKQSIQIGDGIQIVITKIRGNTVQVGIEAPSDVSIVRSELTFRENQIEAKQANSGDASDSRESSSRRASMLPAPPTPAEVHNRLKDEDFLGIRDLPRLRVVRPVEQDNSPLGSFMKSH